MGVASPVSAEEQVGALGWAGGVGKFPERMSGTVEGNSLGRVSQLSVLSVSLLGARTAGELQVFSKTPLAVSEKTGAGGQGTNRELTGSGLASRQQRSRCIPG